MRNLTRMLDTGCLSLWNSAGLSPAGSVARLCPSRLAETGSRRANGEPVRPWGQAMPKTCPQCGLLSPDTAARCDCGYELVGVAAGAPATSRSKNFLAFVVLAFLIGSLWLALLAQGGLPRRSLGTAAGLVAGPFGIAVAVCNWDWFFDTPVVRRWVYRFGRRGVRWLYFLLGVFLTALGIWAITTGAFLPRGRPNV